MECAFDGHYPIKPQEKSCEWQVSDTIDAVGHMIKPTAVQMLFKINI